MSKTICCKDEETQRDLVINEDNSNSSFTYKKIIGDNLEELKEMTKNDHLLDIEEKENKEQQAVKNGEMCFKKKFSVRFFFFSHSFRYGFCSISD